MFALAPILWGAGIGALSSMAFGKDPIKGAVLGGATGGLLDKFPAGAWTGGSAQAASTAPTSMGVNLAPVAADAPISYALAPEIAQGAGVNLTNAVPSVTDAAYAFNPVAQGAGMGSINNLAQYSTGAGYDLMANNPSMFDELRPYLNVRDLSGAAQVASQFQPRPLPTPQGGQETRGQAPQGTDVMALLQTIKQPERRRITLL